MNKSLPLDPSTLRQFEAPIDFVDIAHPDYLDWRQAKLAIDIREGRWMHFIFLPKAGGRPLECFEDTNLLRHQLGPILNRLFDAILPDRDDLLLRYPEKLVSTAMTQEGLPTLSMHGSVRSQKAVMSFSSHEWLRLHGAWSELVKAEAKRKAHHPQ